MAQCSTAPSALASTALSTTSAQVSFTGGSGTSWEIQYGPIGFTLGTGTVQNTSSTTATITLTENLVYDFYVRGNCGSGNFSTWTGPVNMYPVVTDCDDFDEYAIGGPSAQSALITNWGTTNGGLGTISTEQASSGNNSLKAYTSGNGTFTDVVAKFEQPYTSGIHNLSFDIFVASGHGGYYNILHNYVDGVSNTDWAIEVKMDSNGVADPDFADNYNYVVGSWNTLEHIIDLDNDTAFIIVNGAFTDAGWVFSVDNGAYAYQFNAVDFYVEMTSSGTASGQPTGHAGLEYFDNICVTPAPVNDVGIADILVPSGSICGDSSYMIPVVVSNFAMNNQDSFDIDVVISGSISASFNLFYTEVIKPGQSDTLFFGPINTLAGGTVTIGASTDLIGDTDLSNDEIILSGITFLPGVSVQLGPEDTSYCSNETFSMLLDAQNTSATYLWNDNTTASSKTVTTAGTYAVTVTHSNGCTASDDITVTEFTAPIVNLGSDLGDCIGENVSFFLNAGNAGQDILWSTGATTQYIYATSFGPYSVTVTSINGCVDSDDIEIVEYPLPEIGFGTVEACVGDTVMLDAGNPGATYVWSVPNQFGQTYFPSKTGNYSVTVTDTNGCVNKDTAYVTLHPVPYVDLGLNQEINEGESTTLDAGNPGATYLWSNGKTTQTISVTQTGTYFVTVTNSFGCEGVGIVKVTVVTGIGGIKSGEIKVFPNPTSDYVSVQTAFSSSGKLQLDIYTVNGQLIQSHKTGVMAGNHVSKVDLKDVPVGMYLMTISLDGQRLNEFNITKQ
ncbi:MAG: T9SS type A sorting domain-containing protein [Flavobacteriales bacterium]